MERKTRRVYCGEVAIGGGAPITIQSMTNTDTRDVKATIAQIERLTDAGCQIVRCAVPDAEAASAIREIKKEIKIPLVADIHFDYRLALAAIQNGADKVRINPGNIGGDDRIEAILAAAKERGIPIRVGVNSGSLEKELLDKYKGVTAEALAESAVNMVRRIEERGFENVVVSLKSSDVKLNYEAHLLAAQKLTCPFHIGLTESGSAERGKLKSAVGIGALLLCGIGDTMRVSLTGDPVAEVLFAKDLLKAAGVRKTGIDLISCPTCGRTKVDLVKIVEELEEKIKPLEAERLKQGKEPITLAVMGCEVNGPGEAKEADFGVACGKNSGLVFQKGVAVKTCRPDEIVENLLRMIENA